MDRLEQLGQMLLRLEEASRTGTKENIKELESKIMEMYLLK